MLDKPAPDFELPAPGAKIFRPPAQRLSPRPLLLSKRQHPRCTTEASNFAILPGLPEGQLRDLRRARAASKSHESFRPK